MWYSRVNLVWYNIVWYGQSLNELRVLDARQGKYHRPCWTSKTPAPRSFQNLKENSMSRDGQIKHQTLHFFSTKDVNGQQPWGRITMHHPESSCWGKFWVWRRWSDVDWADKEDPFEASPVCMRSSSNLLLIPPPFMCIGSPAHGTQLW